MVRLPAHPLMLSIADLTRHNITDLTTGEVGTRRLNESSTARSALIGDSRECQTHKDY
jgi:hypothetical protein